MTIISFVWSELYVPRDDEGVGRRRRETMVFRGLTIHSYYRQTSSGLHAVLHVYVII